MKNRRFSVFFVIEAVILLFLLVALFRRGFVLVLGFAILFSWLAARSSSRFWRICALIAWIVALIQIFSSGMFWLALIFPLVIIYFYYRRQKYPLDNQAPAAIDNENELIDLADIHYHTDGNQLSIRKISGNTKIIVPVDVEIALNIRVRTGLVRIFDEQTEVNVVSLRYFSDNYESSEKRIAINISVDTGNVELVHA